MQALKKKIAQGCSFAHVGTKNKTSVCASLQ